MTAQELKTLLHHIGQTMDQDYGKYEYIVSYKSYINKRWIIQNMIIRGDHVEDVRQKFSKNKSVSLIKRITKL
jgi:hypothetical protein